MVLKPSEVWRVNTTQRNLKLLFNERIANGTSAGRDGISPQRLAASIEEEVRGASARLRAGRYRFSAYLQILKSKGADSKPRQIALPTARDRMVLRALTQAMRSLAPFVSLELPQGKIARVVESLKSGDYDHFVKLDIKDFYPSINHAWLEVALTKNIRSRILSTTLMQAVRTPTLPRNVRHDGQSNNRGVPQGLAISNGLAEIALRHLDNHFEKMDDVAYFRYVDDVLILCKGDRFSEILDQAKNLVAYVELDIHPLSEAGKTSAGPIGTTIEYLGYKFEWPRVSVRATSIRKLENTIARIFTRYRYRLDIDGATAAATRLEWHLNLVVSGCVFEGKRFGWLAYFSQIRHQQLLEHLDDLVTKQMHRSGDPAIQRKRMVDSIRYAASRRVDTSGFVPNFDTYEAPEMRATLIEVFGHRKGAISRMNDDSVVALFRKRVRGVVVELERDVSGIS